MYEVKPDVIDGDDPNALAAFENRFVLQEMEEYQSLTMEELLMEVSKASIKLGDFDYDTTSINWIGYEGASEVEIKQAEKRLGIVFPEEYKEFLTITNGFPATSNVDPSFLPVSQVKHLRDVDPDLLLLWGKGANPDDSVGEKYDRAIVVGGLLEEQMFFLIPPENNEDWEFWVFANWIPGEEVYVSLKAYLHHTLDFCLEYANKEFITTSR